jgi:triosephosphate isomerase
MKRKIIVGVWKDKLMPIESERQAKELVNIYKGQNLPFDACVAPSPVALRAVNNITNNNSIITVAQDVHWLDSKRSFIGSTSIPMLKEIGINMCMVGHSERRGYFGETDEDIHKKLVGLIEAGIYPILAIGDSVTDISTRKKILTEQLLGALKPDSEKPVNISKIAIAYEPVWAISTWRSDLPLPIGSEVTEMIDLVDTILREDCKLDTSVTPLLYGGSVAPKNAEDYFSCKNVDGALVGGASLTVESLSRIFEIAKEKW